MGLSLCGKQVANTGELACDKSRGILKKLLVFNGTIGSSDYVDEDTFFAKLVANSKLSKEDSNKLFVLNEVQEIADSSDSNKEGTLGLGFKATLLEGKPGYKIKIFAGGDLLKRLRSYNNQTIRVLEYDSNGVIWGTKSGSNFQGLQAKIFVVGNKISTGQNVEEGVVEVTVSFLSTSEYFDNVVWMETGENNVEDIKALNDVVLSKISNVTNVFKIAMKINGSNLKEAYNIYDDYGALIAARTFTAGTGTNYGTALVITSTVVDASLKCLTVTFDSTAYNALSSGTKIKLIPPTPTVLDANDISNIELLPVILTK
jgi:hypothetical protein